MTHRVYRRQFPGFLLENVGTMYILFYRRRRAFFHERHRQDGRGPFGKLNGLAAELVEKSSPRRNAQHATAS